MSCIYKGVVEESELSGKSKGGTEMMRARLMMCTRERRVLRTPSLTKRECAKSMGQVH